MNNRTLLISVNSFISLSELNENIDPKILQPLIKEVQIIKVAPVLGAPLYDKIISDIVGGSLTDDYKTLLQDYIQPFLIQSVLTDLPFVSNYRFTNVGVVTRVSENAKTPDAKELQQVSEFYKTRAARYCDILTAYLCDNEGLYPEYNNARPTPKKGRFDVGIYLG